MSKKADHEEFLDLLASLRTSRSSVRSHSGRHIWRPGLIPPSLEPPHRIQSQFPVPKSTLARVPELNHPDLNQGQRRYLHSIAQIYSLDDTKRSLSNSYYGLLMSELLKGGGRDDSHKRYTVWIYGNHKRLFETNPKIWRSRKLKTTRENSTDRPVTGESDSSRRSSRPKSGRAEKSGTRPAKDSSQSPADAAKPKAPSGNEAQQPKTPARRLQSARSHGSTRSGSGRQFDRAADEPDEESAVRVSQPRASNKASRAQSAVRRSRNDSATTKSDSSNKNKNDEDDSDCDDGRDGRTPRDLGSIMY